MSDTDCLPECRKDSHWDVIGKFPVSMEWEAEKMKNGHLRCQICDQIFKTEHAYCIHQLGTTHQYWLTRKWGQYKKKNKSCTNCGGWLGSGADCVYCCKGCRSFKIDGQCIVCDALSP